MNGSDARRRQLTACPRPRARGAPLVVLSTRLARIIIQERAVSADAKTIKPVDAGGVAGGVKFLVGSIFFK